MTWTPEKIKNLKKLWQKGKTTTEIGKVLGLSKNAVVGKIHRLDLSGKSGGRKNAAKGKAAPVPAKKIKEIQQVTVLKSASKKGKKTAEAATPAKGGMSLMDLKLTSCRWPIGDPKDPDFHFCGETIQPGKPYCPEHSRMAYISLRELTLQNAKNKKSAEAEATKEEE